MDLKITYTGRMKILVERFAHRERMKFLCIFFCIFTFVTQGCRLEHDGEKLFREMLDRRIGYPAKELERLPHVKRMLEDGTTEYQISKDNKCKVAFIADTNGIIVSWRYLSDPKLCKTTFSIGPF